VRVNLVPRKHLVASAARPGRSPAPVAMPPSITVRELLDYTAADTARWHGWMVAQGEGVLDIVVGEGRITTVRGLVHHIFTVERRYADRLSGEPVSPPEAIPSESVDSLFAAGRDARALLERYLETADEHSLARTLEFDTLSAGRFRASARKIVAHALIHGVRHWAQLATIVRQQGRATDWGHDLLLSDALE
jgi:uncharacterized damage-inducible protein DinB